MNKICVALTSHSFGCRVSIYVYIKPSTYLRRYEVPRANMIEATIFQNIVYPSFRLNPLDKTNKYIDGRSILLFPLYLVNL